MCLDNGDYDSSVTGINGILINVLMALFFCTADVAS